MIDFDDAKVGRAAGYAELQLRRQGATVWPIAVARTGKLRPHEPPLPPLSRIWRDVVVECQDYPDRFEARLRNLAGHLVVNRAP
jgi:hypothetical protein